MYLELDADLELTPPHDLRWEIDGIEPRDGVDPKIKVKNCNWIMDLELDLDPEWTPHMI